MLILETVLVMETCAYNREYTVCYDLCGVSPPPPPSLFLQYLQYGVRYTPAPTPGVAGVEMDFGVVFF